MYKYFIISIIIKDIIRASFSSILPALIGLAGTWFGTQTQKDISQYGARESATQRAYDRALESRRLVQEKYLELEKMKLTGQISEMEFQSRKAELEQRKVESQRNYETDLQKLEQTGQISEAELKQRRAEMEQSGRLTLEQLAQTGRLTKEQMAQTGELTREQMTQTGKLTGEQLAQRKAEMAMTGGLRGRELTEAERLNKARETAYSEMLGRAGGVTGEAARGFKTATGETLPELEQMRKDILSGQSEALQRGAGRLGAELAKKGVRGGQAVTQLRRGIGEMSIGAQRDINRMKYEEAARRAAEKRAYLSKMSQTGQQARMTTPMF